MLYREGCFIVWGVFIGSAVLYREGCYVGRGV